MLQNWIGSLGRILTRKREGVETRRHEGAKAQSHEVFKKNKEANKWKELPTLNH